MRDDRIADVLKRLCGERPPADLVRKWVEGDESHAYAEGWVDTLQDWAASHSPWEWATGIGLIDAAEAVADEPRDGYGELWACSCGWSGFPADMQANCMGMRTCPGCGASGGLVMIDVARHGSSRPDPPDAD